MRISSKSRTLAAAVAALALLAPAATAGAAEEVEVPVSVDWRVHNPQPWQCISVGLAKWREVKGATAWRLVYKLAGAERTRQISPPFFDEVYQQRYGWTPGKGMHWHEVIWGSGEHLGRQAADCGAMNAQHRANISDVRLFVTVEDAKIVGTITDTDGDPVEGVTVRAKGAGGDRTDADGEYEIDVPETRRTYVVEPRSSVGTFRPQRRRVAVRPGNTSRANFRMRAERQITGRVRLECRGKSSCKLLPVAGVRVRASGARSYTATTDDDGRYKLAVKKGRYAVSASAGALRITTGRRRVDVRRRKRGSASFGACGIQPPASAAAVAGGRWVGEDCVNWFGIRWSPSAGALTVTWAAAPVCTTLDSPRPQVGKPRFIVRGASVLPGTPGHGLGVQSNAVGFQLPLGAVALNRFVDGTLTAAGGGQARGHWHEGNCNWGDDNTVPIERE